MEKLDDGATDTPDIRGRARSRQLNDLRGHPVGGADNLRLLVLPTSESTGGNSKICEFYCSIFGGENVGALDVSVDNTLVVEILKSL